MNEQLRLNLSGLIYHQVFEHFFVKLFAANQSGMDIFLSNRFLASGLCFFLAHLHNLMWIVARIAMCLLFRSFGMINVLGSDNLNHCLVACKQQKYSNFILIKTEII